MQVKHTISQETDAVITVVSDTKELELIKDTVIKKLSKNVKVTGFREGKAPQALVEKQIDQAALQSEFLEEAINQIYPQAIRSEQLRPVNNPEISITKFVPFETLEFEAKVPVVGKILLPDYKKVKLTKSEVVISTDEVKEVLNSLQKRMAEKSDVKRAAKDGDQVWIDFKGVNDNNEPIKGADGKDYPLVLGSDTFIPGFEKNLIGLKSGDETTFTLTFPKEYGVKTLANKKVTFSVNVTKIQEVTEPKLDDDFAKKAGPFESLKQLKDDIKRQLKIERDQQTQRDYESELVRKITQKSKVAIPKILIEDQIKRMVDEFKKNLTYRGQTFPEYLEGESLTEEEFLRGDIATQAEERVKASLVLSEISEIEKIDLTMEEVDNRIVQLKTQYKDVAMQAELDKPESKNDIASRLVTEKTLALLVSFSAK